MSNQLDAVRTQNETMNKPVEHFLNQIIKKMLPKMNSRMQNGIKEVHLDPWGLVEHGQDILGTINLGICNASATADYLVTNMRGLSSIAIDSLAIKSFNNDPSDPSKLVGTIEMKGAMGAGLSTNIGGGIEARCGFIHPHVGISGKGKVNDVTVSATGTFNASTQFGKVCLESINISEVMVDFGSVDIHIYGLSIFNIFLQPLIDLIVTLFKGKIKSAITNALSSAINNEIKNEMPQCVSMV